MRLSMSTTTRSTKRRSTLRQLRPTPEGLSLRVTVSIDWFPQVANLGGNFYINDKCTGAVIAQTTFRRLACLGYQRKAGGPLTDSLDQSACIKECWVLADYVIRSRPRVNIIVLPDLPVLGALLFSYTKTTTTLKHCIMLDFNNTEIVLAKTGRVRAASFMFGAIKRPWMVNLVNFAPNYCVGNPLPVRLDSAPTLYKQLLARKP